MSNYKELVTVVDAYHQLERGKSVTRIKAAANRLRSLDPANEMLLELAAKIETMDETARAIALSAPQHDQHQAAEMQV
jgi:hypothetical protein